MFLSRRLLSVALQEFCGSIVFMMFYVPLDIYVGCPSDWTPFVLCISTIIMVDVSTDGASCNPSISVAQWVSGTLSATELVVSVSCQIVGALCALPILQLLIKSDIGALAPTMTDTLRPWDFCLESCIGLYVVCSLILEMVVTNPLLLRLMDAMFYALISLISCGITGAYFNPMYAISLLSVSSEAYDQLYQNMSSFIAVYVIGPILGATIATTLWATVGTPSVRELKVKAA